MKILSALLIGLVTLSFSQTSSTMSPQSQASQTRQLSLAERVAYQRAIEEVYWRHRIWPKGNASPKPALDEGISPAQIQKKVENYLRKSQALGDYWQRPITGKQLQAEMERMAQHTKQPEMLRELFAALGDDPFVIAECLAKPALADRLLRSWYAYDQRFHGQLKQRAKADLQTHGTIGQMKQLSGAYSETEFARSEGAQDNASQSPAPEIKLNSQAWDENVQMMAGIFNHSESCLSNGRDGSPSRPLASARHGGQAHVAPYQTLSVGELSSLQEDEGRYYAVAVLGKTNDHLRLATISWQKVPVETWLARAEAGTPSSTSARATGYMLPELPAGGCVDNTWTAVNMTSNPTPEDRGNHTAVWTGSEMIIWGGIHNGVLNTGGRYDPSTDSWTPTSIINAPSARELHTAVWTGSEMIIWGGEDSSDFGVNTGGRYSPSTDTWIATSTANAPDGRRFHTAVWTGNEMIVWGGEEYNTQFNTGGRYNPNTDSWTATSTNNAPSGRIWHTAVWTGSQMIVWGGWDIYGAFNTGGRYDPNTDSWTATSMTNVPDARELHTAVWTGSEMIVWGGDFYNGSCYQYLNTGGKYDPDTDSWTPTSTTNAPETRAYDTAVWTGSEMIVWGGTDFTVNCGGGFFNDGGRYDPGTDNWTPTSTTNAPSARSGHTAVWTGSEMIVWGGIDNTGGRYDPTTDSWITTNSVIGARGYHTAVWTGSEMIVWGGEGSSENELNSGGKYYPSTDTWNATSIINAPDARYFTTPVSTSVWTGNEMIIWGGRYGSFGSLNTGGRYNPISDSWTATSITNAPDPRYDHTAVWSGSEMIVWGGLFYDGNFHYLNTGGRYNPISDSWTATSMTNAPSVRADHTAVWTGSNMIVWGGTFQDGNGYQYLNTGGKYDPGTDSWTPTSITDAPDGRVYHTATWTGSQMIVWGGNHYPSNPDIYFNTGGQYDPGTDSWTATSTTDAPSERAYHTAVWTGSEMIVWGGGYDFDYTNTGGTYNPDTDSWIPTSTDNAPSARAWDTAVWAGNEMIVWGGWTPDGNGTFLGTGGRFCAQSGGPGQTPTPTPTATATAIVTPTTTPAATATPVPSTSPTPTPTLTSTPIATPIPTAVATATATPRPTPSPRSSPSPRPRSTPAPRPTP